MTYHTRVKLCLADDPNEWIVGAIVCLYDRDRLSRDDHLGTGVTNVYGEVSFSFAEADFLDIDDRVGGALPELYIKVYGSDGRLVLSTRASATPNSVPELIRVPVARAVAEAHRLV